MTQESWSYPPELLEALVTFGLKPAATTPPSLVRDALNDLYRFEIRRLRLNLLELAGAGRRLHYRLAQRTGADAEGARR